MSINNIIQILMGRDLISEQEAREAVERCQEELEMIVSAGGTIDEAEDCVAYWLGLEPEYVEVLLDC